MTGNFPRYILAPYLATPPDVVERMIDLAAVRAGDCVYDLGCGDGRMLIAAARRGAQGVGVDIEPYWVEQARAAADAAGVAPQVRFEVQDALEIDASPASVVFLYLVDWSTQRMLRRLQQHCAPGTRVVSHSFGFDGVAGRTESFVDDSGQPRRLHLCLLGAPGAPA